MVPKLELPPSLHMPDLLRFRRSATVRHGLDELQKFISFELFSQKGRITRKNTQGQRFFLSGKVITNQYLKTMYRITNYKAFKAKWENVAEAALSDNVKIVLSSSRRVLFQHEVSIQFYMNAPVSTAMPHATIELRALDEEQLHELAQNLVARLQNKETDFPEDLVSEDPVNY